MDDVITVQGAHPISNPLCLLIGNYDGIHRGHQFIFEQAKNEARTHQLMTAVLSFVPHPLRVLAPNQAPKLIQTDDQKRALLDHYGIDAYIEWPFDHDTAQTPADTFIRQLCNTWLIKRIAVGQSFRFGHKRSGDVALLQEMGKTLGFTCMALDELRDDDVISSTRLRQSITSGSMDRVQHMLDRPFLITGDIVSGKQIGTGIGFPTANLKTQNELMPPHGVYATWMYVQNQWHRSITNIGVRPTFHDDDALHIETHALEPCGNVYGQPAVLAFHSYLRPERKFDGREALIAQIRQDIQERHSLPDVSPPDVPASICQLAST